MHRRDDFAADGFVVLRDALPIRDVEACAEALQTLPVRHPGLAAPQGAPAAARIDAQLRAARLGNAEDAVDAVALNPDVVAALARILGDEPVSRYTRLLAQSPGAQPVNRDKDGTPHLHNFGMATRPAGQRVIAWTPVDDVLAQAGPMWVAPGSHRAMADFPDTLLDAQPDARKALHRMWRDGACAEDWLRWHGALGEASMRMLARWQETSGLERVPVMLGRGDVLIFSNDLLHGTLRAEDPAISRRIMFTHYHAAHAELWELGDAVGRDINPAGPRLHGGEYERGRRGLSDPSGLGRFYRSQKGFFGPAAHDGAWGD